MFKVNRASAPTRKRDGLLSHILLQKGDVPGTQLSITWVEVAPGGSQMPHSHTPEQVYIVIQGTGEIVVGEDSSSVQAGDLIRIPPGAIHSIKNTGTTMLTYISASTPSHDFLALYDSGQLQPKTAGSSPE